MDSHYVLPNVSFQREFKEITYLHAFRLLSRKGTDILHLPFFLQWEIYPGRRMTFLVQ